MGRQQRLGLPQSETQWRAVSSNDVGVGGVVSPHVILGTKHVQLEGGVRLLLPAPLGSGSLLVGDVVQRHQDVLAPVHGGGVGAAEHVVELGWSEQVVKALRQLCSQLGKEVRREVRGHDAEYMISHNESEITNLV